MAPTKGKKQQRRAIKTTVTVDDSDTNTNDEIMVAGPPRARPSGGGRKRSRSNDWDAWQDSVRTREADRVRQYARTFQTQVEASRAEARQELQQSETRRMDTDADFLARLRTAYHGSEGQVPAATDAVSRPLCTASREVLDLLRALLARYDATNVALAEQCERSCGSARGSDGSGQAVRAVRAVGVAAGTGAAWENDRDEARKLLRYGRIYGDSLVHDIIVPRGSTPVATPAAVPAHSADLSRTGRSAIGLFPRSQAVAAGGRTWGETARTQMQALTGLVRTLPSGEAAEAAGTKIVSFVE